MEPRKRGRPVIHGNYGKDLVDDVDRVVWHGDRSKKEISRLLVAGQVVRVLEGNGGKTRFPRLIEGRNGKWSVRVLVKLFQFLEYEDFMELADLVEARLKNGAKVVDIEKDLVALKKLQT